MEHFVNEITVMQFYVDQVQKDQINFLQGKEAKKKVICELINQLMAEDKMNYKIQIACKLWKELFEVSMSFISADKTGYDKLFQYFDAYVEFEELIFASDSFYRDHTLHCIWVYFLGEYLKRKEEFRELFTDEVNEEELERNMGAFLSELKAVENAKEVELMERALELNEKLRKYDEAIRCVSALTHDLGYPLKKIEKINKSIKKVLPYFAINNFEDFSFGYTNVQQEFVRDFIDFLSRRYGINMDMKNDEASNVYSKLAINDEQGHMRKLEPGEIQNLTDEERKQLVGSIYISEQFHAPEAVRVGFLNDFEDYRHGIMSAFLLFKNLRAFQHVDYRKMNDALGSSMEYPGVETLAVQAILSAISLHTNDMFRISYLTGIEYLTFVDELEEFSRISRASQNREYVKEFCDTALYMEDGWLNVVFEFGNDQLDNLDPEISFKGRCKRFLNLFDVKGMSENLKIRVTCIGKLPTNKNTYVLEIARKHVDIRINDESVDIPKYLKSCQYYTKEEYAAL